MFRRMFPVLDGDPVLRRRTTQLLAADFSPTVLPSRLVVFGMLPSARIAVIDALPVYALIQSTAAALLAPTGTPRLEPPWKFGIA